MARTLWHVVAVELGEPNGPEVAQACQKLTDQGWLVAFIVPVFHGHVQVLATRDMKPLPTEQPLKGPYTLGPAAATERPKK